jgi:DNA-binding MarR family transcriptional regulator
MKKNKLITQSADAKDNRAKLIYLTQKGKMVQSTAVRISGALYTKILRNIDQDKLKIGTELFQNMINNF